MSKKTERQAKALKEMSVAVQKRNTHIMYLLEENRQLRKQNFELWCAIRAIDDRIVFHPYGGYSDPQVIDILDEHGVKWRRNHDG